MLQIVLPDLSHILMFLVATVVVNLTPGADVLYIASRTLTQGKKHGLLAAIGISSGLILHVIITAFGVGEIFQYSPLAFWALKILGAGYLAYLGWKSFFSKESPFEPSSKTQKRSPLKTFLGGVLTTTLNPKVIIFFLTFLPQFVSPEKGSVMFQLFVLGGLFILSGTIVNLFYAFFLSLIKEIMLKSQKLVSAFQKVTGFLFASLAVKLLMAESR